MMHADPRWLQVIAWAAVAGLGFGLSGCRAVEHGGRRTAPATARSSGPPPAAVDWISFRCPAVPVRGAAKKPSEPGRAAGRSDQPGDEKPAPGAACIRLPYVDAVVAPIRRNIPDFKRCYERLLDRQPEAAGSLFLRIRLTPAGRAAGGATRAPGLEWAEFHACAAAVVCGIEFGRLQDADRSPFEFELIMHPGPAAKRR